MIFCNFKKIIQCMVEKKKKIILILTLIFLSHFCFAGIVVQNSIIPFGYNFDYDENCFRVDKEKEFSCEFSNYLLSFNGGLLWEFNSKKTDIPFHFMTGVEIGFSRHGFFSFTFPLIFQFTLLKLEKSIIELQVNVDFGYTHGIKGGVFFFYSPSIDVTFGSKSRKWFYGGVGVGTEGTFSAAHYKDYGNDIDIEATMGLHLFVGVRFPTW